MYGQTDIAKHCNFLFAYALNNERLLWDSVINRCYSIKNRSLVSSYQYWETMTFWIYNIYYSAITTGFIRLIFRFLQVKRVKWFRYTPWRRIGWEEVQLLLILNLDTRWGWVVSITPRPRFTPGKRAPGTHCTGGWLVPRAGLDAEARGKILCLCWGLNPGRPVRSQTLYCLSYSGF
jgi:hypothetical protein